MIGFVWLLLLGGVVGTSYPHSVWEAHLKNINPYLPWTTVQEGSMVCYMFDLNPQCSTAAAADLLGLDSPLDMVTWAPGDGQCDLLLDGQLPYFESVASSVFATAISRATAVPNFELLTQYWVLKVGHHPLTTTYAAFVAVINGVTDWSTVYCDGTNLAHDSLTTPLPDFASTVDCDILGFSHTCARSDCTMSDAINCCNKDSSSTCCGVFGPNMCQSAGCPVRDYCCSQYPTSLCCA